MSTVQMSTVHGTILDHFEVGKVYKWIAGSDYSHSCMNIEMLKWKDGKPRRCLKRTGDLYCFEDMEGSWMYTSFIEECFEEVETIINLNINQSNKVEFEDIYDITQRINALPPLIASDFVPYDPVPRGFFGSGYPTIGVDSNKDMLDSWNFIMESMKSFPMSLKERSKPISKRETRRKKLLKSIDPNN